MPQVMKPLCGTWSWPVFSDDGFHESWAVLVFELGQFAFGGITVGNANQRDRAFDGHCVGDGIVTARTTAEHPEPRRTQRGGAATKALLTTDFLARQGRNQIQTVKPRNTPNTRKEKMRLVKLGIARHRPQTSFKTAEREGFAKAMRENCAKTTTLFRIEVRINTDGRPEQKGTPQPAGITNG